LNTYPFFSLTQATSYDGTSIYHGGNFRVQKKFSHGLILNVAYTVSKKITNALTSNPGSFAVDAIHGTGSIGGRTQFAGFRGAGYQDPDNRRDRVISVDDVPQMLNVFGSYEIPFGSGKAFLNQKGVLNGVFGGWKLAANFNAQSGIPLGISCPGNELSSIGSFYGVSRCNLIGNPTFHGDRSKEQQIADWINPAAFEPPFGSDQKFWANYDPTDDRAWRFGTAGPRLPGLRSPGFWSMDATLMKRFPITESKYFEFRWELFNALNHQNLGFPNTQFCLPPGPNGETDRVHKAGCTFGRITNIATDARAMEFGLKFFW
jgi:hypothetical protein